jgi:hypothetical protein
VSNDDHRFAGVMEPEILEHGIYAAANVGIGFCTRV